MQQPLLSVTNAALAVHLSFHLKANGIKGSSLYTLPKLLDNLRNTSNQCLWQMSEDGRLVSPTTYHLNELRREKRAGVEQLVQSVMASGVQPPRHQQVAIRRQLEQLATIDQLQRVNVSSGNVAKGFRQNVQHSFAQTFC